MFLLLAPASGFAQSSTEGFVESLKADFRYHYSSQPLTEVAVGFGFTALLANSGIDENTQRFFREKMQGQAGDSLSKFFTGVGDVAQPLYSIPIYVAMSGPVVTTVSQNPLRRAGQLNLCVVC